MIGYEEYVRIQRKDGCSLESDNELWRKGQERFIKRIFGRLSRRKNILDIACGDGVGLRQFKKMGFEKVVGVEFNPVKNKIAKKYGYKVINSDIHDLKKLYGRKFDIIYSSHTLEHAYDAKKVLREFEKILADRGNLIVVLPYPDMHDFNREVHISKKIIGLTQDDDGKSIENFFNGNGFKIKKKIYDYFREPEIWLILDRQ